MVKGAVRTATHDLRLIERFCLLSSGQFHLADVETGFGFDKCKTVNVKSGSRGRIRTYDPPEAD